MQAVDQHELAVHLADVSHFVSLDSPMDIEARRRGNSAYLPRRVVPMLPETLSNGVCSLQEGVPRFCKSAFIRFDTKGKVLDERFAQTVIRSAKRLTYLEAQNLIDGRPAEAKRHARNDTEPTDEVVANLRLANTLARLLQKRRRAQGQLVLELPQSELVYDEQGHVVDAVPEDDAFTHTLIEMFMVEANEAVARLFSATEIPLIRRIHPPPAFKEMEELRAFARTVGFRLPDEPERADLLQLLDHTRGTDSARAVHFAVLKTLAKATYAPALIGHYALASEHYAHFTSPIRRYPDLTVHRSLEAWLELSDNGRSPPGGRRRRDAKASLEVDPRCPVEGALAEIGRHCSETEVNAEAAERDLRNFLVLQFLKEHHMSDELDAVVTGMSPQGVWVSIRKYLADGLVRFNALPSARDRPDRWTVNAQRRQRGSGRQREGGHPGHRPAKPHHGPVHRSPEPRADHAARGRHHHAREGRTRPRWPRSTARSAWSRRHQLDAGSQARIQARATRTQEPLARTLAGGARLHGLPCFARGEIREVIHEHAGASTLAFHATLSDQLLRLPHQLVQPSTLSGVKPRDANGGAGVGIAREIDGLTIRDRSPASTSDLRITQRAGRHVGARAQAGTRRLIHTAGHQIRAILKPDRRARAVRPRVFADDAHTRHGGQMRIQGLTGATGERRQIGNRCVAQCLQGHNQMHAMGRAHHTPLLGRPTASLGCCTGPRTHVLSVVDPRMSDFADSWNRRIHCPPPANLLSSRACLHGDIGPNTLSLLLVAHLPRVKRRAKWSSIPTPK